MPFSWGRKKQEIKNCKLHKALACAVRSSLEKSITSSLLHCSLNPEEKEDRNSFPKKQTNNNQKNHKNFSNVLNT